MACLPTQFLLFGHHSTQGLHIHGNEPSPMFNPDDPYWYVYQNDSRFVPQPGMYTKIDSYAVIIKDWTFNKTAWVLRSQVGVVGAACGRKGLHLAAVLNTLRLCNANFARKRKCRVRPAPAVASTACSSSLLSPHLSSSCNSGTHGQRPHQCACWYLVCAGHTGGGACRR
jgi:hypothetical protein